MTLKYPQRYLHLIECHHYSALYDQRTQISLPAPFLCHRAHHNNHKIYMGFSTSRAALFRSVCLFVWGSCLFNLNYIRGMESIQVPQQWFIERKKIVDKNDKWRCKLKWMGHKREAIL